MLKLLKYEIKGNYKRFLMIYGAFVFLMFIFTSMDDTSKVTLVNNPMKIAYGVVLIFTIINFSRSINNSEGYLTLSLPVRKIELLAIKLINYFLKLITIFISTILLSLWCVLLNHNTFSALFNELSNMKWDLLYYSMSRTLEGVMFILTLWLTIAVCNMENLNKIASTVVGVCTFMLTTLIIGILGFLTLHFSWMLPVHTFENSCHFIQIGGYGNLSFDIYKVIVIAILFIFTASLLENRVEI